MTSRNFWGVLTRVYSFLYILCWERGVSLERRVERAQLFIIIEYRWSEVLAHLCAVRLLGWSHVSCLLSERGGRGLLLYSQSLSLSFFYGCPVLCSTPRGAAAALKHASRHAGDEDDGGGEEGAKPSIMPRTLIAPLNHIFSPPFLPPSREDRAVSGFLHIHAGAHASLSLPLLWCRLTLCFLLL